MITVTLRADDISELILQIQHSKSSQKRVLINQLKLKLKGMNASKRADAISNLRKSTHFNAQSIHSHAVFHKVKTHGVEVSSSTKQMNKHGRR
jgi:hypothetical protein